MTPERCPHCNSPIEPPSPGLAAPRRSAADRERTCPTCHQPFPVPGPLPPVEAGALGPDDFPPELPKERRERPQPRRPLPRTSKYPWILASAFGLLTVALGIVVAILISRQSVAEKLIYGGEEKETRPQPTPALRPPTTSPAGTGSSELYPPGRRSGYSVRQPAAVSLLPGGPGQCRSRGPDLVRYMTFETWEGQPT